MHILSLETLNSTRYMTIAIEDTSSVDAMVEEYHSADRRIGFLGTYYYKGSISLKQKTIYYKGSEL